MLDFSSIHRELERPLPEPAPSKKDVMKILGDLRSSFLLTFRLESLVYTVPFAESLTKGDRLKEWRGYLARAEHLLLYTSATVLDCLNLCQEKNQKYGCEVLLETGCLGISVRCLDKINRVLTMTRLGLESSDESVEDTLKDLFNYCALAILLLEGKLHVRA